MNKLTVSALALLSILSLSHAGQADSTLQNNSAVIDHNRRVVRVYSNGTCVRTQWEHGADVCAATPAAIMTTRTVLTDDERSVFFEFNHSDLTGQARINLDHLSRRLMKADDVVSIDIIGHADRIGSSDYNNKLSGRRAVAVKDYLIQQGYKNIGVTELRAAGESQPQTNCDVGGDRKNEIRCLSPDRRVDIQLTYADQVRTTSSR